MKSFNKNLLFIIFCIASNSCFAQNTIVPLESFYSTVDYEGKYFKDINDELDKYMGTWAYDDDTKRLELHLTIEREADYGGGYTADYVVGNYVYSENAQVVIDTHTSPQQAPTSVVTNYHVVLISNSGLSEQNYLSGYLDDPVRSPDVNYSLYLKYKPSYFLLGQGQQPATLEWRHQTEGHLSGPNVDITIPIEPRLPLRAVLVKQ